MSGVLSVPLTGDPGGEQPSSSLSVEYAGIAGEVGSLRIFLTQGSNPPALRWQRPVSSTTRSVCTGIEQEQDHVTELPDRWENSENVARQGGSAFSEEPQCGLLSASLSRGWPARRYKSFA